jgi:hypothetical protein
MLRTLGFTYITVEFAYWAVGAIAVISLIAAWAVDAILDDLALGFLPNWFVMATSAVAGLIVCNLYVLPLRSADILTITMVAVGSGFGTLLALLIVKRLITA